MPKGSGAKVTAARTKPAKDTSAGKGNKGSGASAEQADLFAAESAKGGKSAAKGAPPTEPAEAPATPKPPPVPEGPVVVELANGVDGVWKKLSNGKRVDLTTKEWRQELSRLFTRAPAP
jgi:hypothetical protein